MAAPIGSLYVVLTANVGPLAQGMSRAETIVAKTAGGIRRNVGVAERSVNSFWNTAGRSNFRPYSLIAVSRAFDNVNDRAGLLRGSLLATTGILGGFAAALSSNVVLRYADSFTNLTNQLRVVSSGAADTRARFSDVEEIARRSRSSLEATAVLYSRIQKAAPTRGAEEISRFVETIQKALTLGGATAQEARSAAIQFSQAIASNRLGGEELRAILETPLGLELARGLGVTLGKFREMGHAGELTADVVLGALDKISTRIDGQFSQSVRTLDQALIHVDNRLTAYIGGLNKAYGGTGLLGDAIVALGDNLETIVPVLANILGLLGAISIARRKGLVGGIIGGAAGAFLGNEVGGLTGAMVGAGVGGLLGLRSHGAFTSFRADARAAKDDVRDLTGQVSTLKREFLATADARRQALVAAKGDPFLAARPSLVANVERKALNPGASINQIYAAQAAAVKDGQNKLTESVARTTIAYKAAGIEYSNAKKQLVDLAKSATIAGQAKAFLGRQASSLVGLFGGPWGVAITAAIGLLSYLGLRSRKAAQEIASAQAIIRERLELIAAAGGEEGQFSLNRLRMEELEAQKTELDKLIVAQQAAASSLSPIRALPAIQAAKDEILSLIRGLGEGKISALQFSERLAHISANVPSLRRMAENAGDGSKQLGDAALSAASLSKEIEELLAKVNAPMELRFNIAFGGSFGAGDLGAALEARGLRDVTSTAIAGFEQRFSQAGVFAEFDKQRKSATKAITRDLDEKIGVARLSTQGLVAEAKAQEIINKERAEGRFVDEGAILAKVQLLQSLEDETAALNKAGKAAETFTQRIARLRAESTGAFLPDLDRQVIEQARGLKVAASMIDEYVAAVKSGDLSNAPDLLLQLRDQEQFDRAAESARGIIQQYGLWPQIAGMAAAKQQELNVAVMNGAITSEQAKTAYADFLGQFGQYQWINELSSAVGDFVKSGLEGFDGLVQGAMNFIKRIRDIAVEILVVEPLMRSLRGWMAGGVGGGGGGLAGIIGSLFGRGASGAGAGGMGIGMSTLSTLYHAGGMVAANNNNPKVARPANVVAMAPRFHGGRRADEIDAVLKIGERVLTEEMHRREKGVIAGLAGVATAGGGGIGSPEIHIHEAPGTKAEVQQRDDGNIHIMLRRIKTEVAKDIAGNGIIGKAIVENHQAPRRKKN